MLGVGGAVSSPAVAGLHAALADYRPSSDLGAELIAPTHFRDLVDLALARAAGRLADSGRWEEEGHLSPVAWLRYEAKMATGVACDRLAVGCNLALVPESVVALERGEIGFAHLALMARTADLYSGGGFAEGPLLARAREQTVTEFRRTCEHVRHAQDPVGFADDEARGREERFLELSPQDDGSLWLKGWLEPEGASLVRSALEPLARPGGAGEGRTRAQRLADALLEGLTKELRVELVVTCSLATLEGRPGSPAAETEWGGLLSGRTVERLACGARLRRLVLDGESVVVDLGRRRRLLSAPARRALEARDRHCVWPGCDRPARWCQSHHREEWARGGVTSVQGSELLCGRHHRLRHERGWLLLREHGAWTALPPPPPTWFSDPPGT